MIPTVDVRVSVQELKRIEGEMLKMQALADPSQRGTSAGSVVKYALNRSGRQALTAAKRRVPRGTGPLKPQNKGRPRVRLARAVRGKIELDRRLRQLWFRAGYQKRLVNRFQQSLAIEFGTRFINRREPLKRGLDDAIGITGERFKRLFVTEMQKRINALAAKANAGARARRRR